MDDKKKRPNLGKSALYFYRSSFYKLKKGFVNFWHKSKQFGVKLYNFLKIKEVFFFILFLFRRYSPKQFNLLNVSYNMKMLFRKHPYEGISASKEGKLKIFSKPYEKFKFSLGNFLTLGALQKRVERAIFYTYLTLTIELNNPFSKKHLMIFLDKKLALLKRHLDLMKNINGKKWNQNEIILHIDIFKRNSLLQAKVIDNMVQAVKQEKNRALIQEAAKAMQKGLHPLLSTVGMSGAYWLRGMERQIIGLFKPFDEEIHAPNNPLGPRYQGTLGLRKTRRGCRVGESAHHEVAAFLVDEFLGFGIVPRTYYASFQHHAFYLARENLLTSMRVNKTKLGSFQEFVKGFVHVDQLKQEGLAAIPLDELQLLAVLDVFIGNTDRNIGNVLFREDKIAAIDHGLCFPDMIESFSFWYWNFFEQGKKPFLPSIVELLNHFPFAELGTKLQQKCFISIKSLQRAKERVVLFTEAVNQGLVLAQMEGLMQPEYLYLLKDFDVTLQEKAASIVGGYKTNLEDI